MSKSYRITLWSGGKAAMVSYVKETPKMSEGVVAFRTDDGYIVRIMGNISIEEGGFSESGRITRR